MIVGQESQKTRKGLVVDNELWGEEGKQVQRQFIDNLNHNSDILEPQKRIFNNYAVLTKFQETGKKLKLRSRVRETKYCIQIQVIETC